MHPLRITLSAFALLALLSACGSTAQEQRRTVATDDGTGTQDRTPPRVATSGGESNTAPAACVAAVRPIYFDFDVSALSSTGRDQLAADARCIQAQGVVEVSLVGATDPRGTEEYNLALGERRARSVADYLASLGIARSKLHVRSVGEEMASDDESMWAQDRNVKQD